MTDAVGAWARIAVHSFGGPAGQIGIIHRVLVEEKRWLEESRFLHALSYCMLLPGPEAQQLVTYAGWLTHGVRGGLVAGLLFVAPGFLSILALSVAYVEYRDVGLVSWLFFGLKPAVAAIVVEAVLRLRRRALRDRLAVALAIGAFAAIFFFAVPFPVIVVAAAALGYARYRVARAPPGGTSHHGSRPPLAHLARTVTAWLLVWLGPVVALLVTLGPTHVLVREATFFSKVAVVTFGGAYAVLAYVAQQAVVVHGWLAPGEMIDGLGLAETTPGPLIMVVQFVGFVGAYRAASVHPLIAGVWGSLVTTWVTFAPCFLFVFAGAPYVEWLRGHRALSAALTGVMAAVVGVVLNLAVWFGLHVLFASVTRATIGPAHLWVPNPETVVPAAALIMVGALVGVFRFRWGMFTVLAFGGLAGVVLQGLFFGLRLPLVE